jgi:PTH1 family peptidyl-tRNA hydrolase
MKYLIVGLGNPGEEYEKTRHNAGFLVLDKLASKLGAEWKSERHGWIARGSHKGRQLILLKPNTYMNLSGKAVSYWMQMDKVKPENTLVILDDLALPTGKLRLRLNGSDGGHNGLRSIDSTLGMNKYPRLRFGIGKDFFPGKQVEYVLAPFKKEEEQEVEEALIKAADSVLLFATFAPGLAMTQINAS